MKGVLLLFVTVLASDIAVFENTLSAEQCRALTDANHEAAVVFLSSNPLWEHLDGVLFNATHAALRSYVEQYPELPPAVSHDNGYTLVERTKESAPSTLTAGAPPFVIGIVLFLNEDVGGGELSFPRQQERVTPACGRMVLFPASYTHPLRLEPVRIGSLFLISTWIKP